MLVDRKEDGQGPHARSTKWGAVCALTLCVSTLIASEFMPVSLLTPIAADLQMTEGGAGQAIAVSGLFALLDAYNRAAEPKELVIVPGAGRVDLYDRVNLIPFDKLQAFFTRHLA
jgi:hypothetical protein